MITLLSDVIGSTFSRQVFQPIRSETKANRGSSMYIFLRSVSATCSFDWFPGLSPSFLIGQSNYFGFGFTTLN